MPQVPFSQVVEILEAAGYSMHHRRKSAGQSESYYYFFAHKDRNHPCIGFPVVGRMVQGRYYELILDALKGSKSHEEDEQDD